MEDPLMYAMNWMERAAQKICPAEYGYGEARRELIDGIAALRARIAALEEQVAAKNERIAKLELWRDEYPMAVRMDRAGVDRVEDLCRDCDGLGVKAYADSSMWRRGPSGQAITAGPCDKCWGSGNPRRPWTDLRVVESELGKVATLTRELDEANATRTAAQAASTRDLLRAREAERERDEARAVIAAAIALRESVQRDLYTCFNDAVESAIAQAGRAGRPINIFAAKDELRRVVAERIARYNAVEAEFDAVIAGTPPTCRWTRHGFDWMQGCVPDLRPDEDGLAQEVGYTFCPSCGRRVEWEEVSHGD